MEEDIKPLRLRISLEAIAGHPEQKQVREWLQVNQDELKIFFEEFSKEIDSNWMEKLRQKCRELNFPEVKA